MARHTVIFTLLYLFTTISPAVAESSDVPFPVHTVEKQSIVQEIRLDAVIEPVNRSTVSAETSGRVMEINFDIGDFVKAGSVLIRVTQAEQQAQVAAADAQRIEAEARVQEARDEFTRVKDVFERQLVAQSALDAAKANLKATEQRYEAAVARVKQAQEQLRYTSVKAPYSGVVVERHVDVGEMVAPGKPVMSGMSLRNLRAVAHVPQSFLADLRAAGQVRLIVSRPQPGQMQETVVKSEQLQIAPQADPASHTFLVRAYLPQDTTDVFPGMSAKMAIPTGGKDTVVVPANAVVHRSELTGVYVVKDGRVHLRQVRIGRRQGDQVEILAGLEAGEQVALDPIQAGIFLKEQSQKVQQQNETKA